MRIIFISGLILSLVAFASLVDASEPESAEHWDRNSAIAAVQSVSINATILEISDISSLADGEATVEQLTNLADRTDWPLPVREAALLKFTRSLSDLPADAVSPEIVHYLQNYQAKTLVPHEEHPQAYIPLFNIRGAIAGVTNGWQRRESARDAAILMHKNPGKLISDFAKSTNPNQRAGYLDALGFADMDTLISLQDAALEQLEVTPGLAPMVAVTAVITMDLAAIEQLLLKASGAGLPATLKKIEKQLAAADTAGLLAFAIQSAPTTNAALAISAWWPRLSHDNTSRELMVGLLASPELGASAAMALARSPDIQTITALKELAAGDSPASRRAKMALDLSHEQLIGEVLR